jgi:hypothetical protein
MAATMALETREKIIENLAVGLALGFLTLTVAALSLVADSHSIVAEGGALAIAPASAIVASSVYDQSFDRVFSINDTSGLSFGAVMAFRSSDDSALVRARFSPKGELLDLRYLGACASRLPADVKDALGEFVGAAEALSRAAEAVRSAARGSVGGAEAGI